MMRDAGQGPNRFQVICCDSNTGWRSLHTLSAHEVEHRYLWVTRGLLSRTQLGQEGPSWESSGNEGYQAGPYQAPSIVPRLPCGMEIPVHTFGSQGRAKVGLDNWGLLCGAQLIQQGPSGGSSGDG